MKNRLVCFGITATTVLAGLCWAYPEPAVVPGMNESREIWTLEVVFDKPRQISVKLPGSVAAPQRFWYIILSLTNTSRLDVPFFPTCDLMTDTFQIISAGKNVSKAAFEQIKKRHIGKYPFLEPLDLVGGRILQGADNARDVAIIWSDFDPKAKNISLFIAGLSNETVAIDHPVIKQTDGVPIKVYLRKTLQLDYAIGGDERLREKAALAYKSKRWVMR